MTNWSFIHDNGLRDNRDYLILGRVCHSNVTVCNLRLVITWITATFLELRDFRQRLFPCENRELVDSRHVVVDQVLLIT